MIKRLSDKKRIIATKSAKIKRKKGSKILFTVLNLKKCVAVFMAIVLLLILGSIFLPARLSTVSGSERLIPIYSVEREQKVVSISFDCAWGVDYTDSILNVMEEENIKCTFFTVEFWVNKHLDYVKKIVDAGHEIGTHSATHPHMAKLSKEAIVSELSTSKNAIERITGKTVNLFRAPFGEYNNRVIETAKTLGLFTIQWDVDSLDWKDLGKNEIKNRVITRVKNGSIVLFHNQGKHTSEALPEIIKGLKGKGYSFLPISQLIYTNNYKVLPNGRQVQVD